MKGKLFSLMAMVAVLAATLFAGQVFAVTTLNFPNGIINTSGNVGIGTTGPNGKVDIYADNLASATAGDLTLEHPTSGGASSIIFPSRSNYGSDYGYITYSDENTTYAYWGTSAENSALVIGTQNDGMGSVSDVVALHGAAADILGTNTYPSTMIVNDAGNVGIGTTSPGQKLEVNGNTSIDGNLYVSSPGGAWLSGKTGTNGITAASAQTASAYTPILRQTTASGNVVALGGLGDGFGFTTYNAARTANGVDYFPLWFSTTNGYVGIGNSAPGYTLDVSGTGNFTGVVNVGTPTSASNAATKAYVDSAVAGASGQWTTGSGLIYYNGGNVGIGTSGPGAKLEIDGNTSAPALSIQDGSGIDNGPAYGMVNLSRAADTTKADIAFIRTGIYVWQMGYVQNSNTFGIFPWNFSGTQGTPAMAFTTGGNVGIGTTSPGTKLQVNGEILANEGTWGTGGYSFVGDGGYDTGMFSPSDGVTDFYNNTAHTVNITPSAATVYVPTTFTSGIFLNPNNELDYWGGNTPYRTWMDNNSTYFYGSVQDYAIHFTMDAEDSGRGFTWGAYGSQPSMSVDVNGNLSLKGTVTANKVTANTFDPVYAIGGTNYATYLSGMTGVKEETAGTIMLQKGMDGTYQATINFAKEPTGSDLWLFAKATEMPSAMDQLAVLLTPSFDGNVWYRKDTAAGTLTIYGASAPGSMAAGAAAGGYEVSYRLTAPRFDAAKWTNYGDPSAKGLLITP